MLWCNTLPRQKFWRSWNSRALLREVFELPLFRPDLIDQCLWFARGVSSRYRKYSVLWNGYNRKWSFWCLCSGLARAGSELPRRGHQVSVAPGCVPLAPASVFSVSREVLVRQHICSLLGGFCVGHQQGWGGVCFVFFLVSWTRSNKCISWEFDL